MSPRTWHETPPPWRLSEYRDYRPISSYALIGDLHTVALEVGTGRFYDEIILDSLKDVANELTKDEGGSAVAIALATVFQPSLIIADEPTTALDVVVQRGVLQMIKDIQAMSSNTVLLVTHDMAVHANVADRVAIMYAGRIVED